MNPSVAVVVPTHNRADLLCRALASVTSQTLKPSRVVVVDDGSTDGTPDRVSARFPTVEVIVQDNAGVSAARNRGIAACSEDWIAFLDSDDEWKPEKLERQLTALMNAESTVALVHCDEVWIRRGNQVLQRRRHRKRGGRIFKDCLPLCAISPSASLVRSSVLEELGGFSTDFPACEDYDLWLRLSARYEVLFVDEPLVVKYGGHDDQLSRRFPVMDRLRIRALIRLLDSDARSLLSADELEATRDTLNDKVNIVAGGARKRGRLAEAEELEALARATLERTGQRIADAAGGSR